MSRPDDSTLEHQQLISVQRHADLLLQKASAYNRFPTRIDDLMEAAKLQVVEDADMHEGMLRKFLKNAASGFAQTFKSAWSKVLGLFEANDRIVLIDKDTPAPRVPFIKLHEAGHGSIPHQSKMYAIIHDCEKTLDPDTTDLFEREANVFASEVLFQGSVFLQEASQLTFNVKTPISLARKFGASNYSTFRRYVTTNPHACCVVVLNPFTLEIDGTFHPELRRIIPSTTFHNIFDCLFLFTAIDHAHVIAPAIPLGSKRMTAPKEIILVDRNGQQHLCLAEGFNTKHQIFVLIRDSGAFTTVGIIVPSHYAVN
jgi:Zn-dependent peptidase ImmA (M78 family)